MTGAHRCRKGVYYKLLQNVRLQPGPESQYSERNLRITVQFHEFDNAYFIRLRDGDPETERHFIEYFNPLLLIKLRRRLHSTSLIDDIRQETFLRTFRAIRNTDTIRQPDRLGAFVNRMCENVMHEHLRKDSRTEPLTDTTGEAPEPRPDVESELISAERQTIVRKVIGTLREQDRSLLRALFFEERDKDEVCRDLGVDRGYLRVMLHRAKNQFKREYLKRAAGTAGSD